ncbi:MAG TPA: class I SAM-dependent methyltransferase [Solirubrobacteraceae bacterium]|nr:class I SAM-dependent methyltransferase [Solirubrobacteraceae bacterium]
MTRVRDPWALNERLFSLYYPRLLALAENAGQRETRRELIAAARGRTLELGAGNGINLPHFTERVSELVITEPSPHMVAQLRRELADAPPAPPKVELRQAGAEALPFAEGSFDTIVATYILCTTPDPSRVLAEVHRLLVPGGTYLFLEHVHDGEGTLLGRFQDLVEVPHRYIAAGCHPNRRTEALLAASELDVLWLEHGRQPRALPTVRPTIRGAARRNDPA